MDRCRVSIGSPLLKMLSDEKSTNRGLSQLEKMAALNAHEEKLFHFFKKVSLEDLYEHENTNRIKNYNNII